MNTTKMSVAVTYLPLTRRAGEKWMHDLPEGAKQEELRKAQQQQQQTKPKM